MKGEKKVEGLGARLGSELLCAALASAVRDAAARWGCALEEVGEAIADVVEGDVASMIGAVMGAAAEGRKGEVQDREKGGAWDGYLSDEARRAHGVHFTPDAVAQRLVGLLDDLATPGPIVDPACGAGALLLAADRRWPRRALVGVERDPLLAMVAALRLLDARRGREHAGVRIVVGDGLAPLPDALDGRVAAVVMNPPYVPEKGHGEALAAVLRAHPRFEDVRGTRADLLYYFLARSVEMLAPAGQAAWLTPPHWLRADGACRLRAWLLKRGAMERFAWCEARGVFDATPGQEVLLSAFRRGEALREPRWRAEVILDGTQGDASAGWQKVQPQSLGEARWSPRADAKVLGWGARRKRQGRPLGELVRDFQGVVSGADRVTRRHERNFGGEYGWEVGAPIFLSESAHPPERWEPLLPYVRPVLRSGRLEAGRTYETEVAHAWMLYLDGEVDAAHLPAVEAVLGPYRPILEARREVRLGKMPWYRLHWPRDARAMRTPKLVVPRRAKHPCFALDLSGAVVSSDCTFLVAPDHVQDTRRYLRALMAELNSEETERYLRVFGKRKGELLEFYSSPLRELPVVGWPAVE
ncbi:N-6 DNA methylase [Lujinxingia vulgaris]|uniref:site-specific DNA-methyltransferase (adenine-specific) n=1 Tax=Lujinxingia vulgaris TaxID=2600176 RepID=A0A5C6XG18_9DELT|nr:N-6 DNA methylase [Lujinxingia vulgaris]TXD37827.1 N-6 DNA methylase [Lujinxingia vulgaris]